MDPQVPWNLVKQAQANAVLDLGAFSMPNNGPQDVVQAFDRSIEVVKDSLLQDLKAGRPVSIPKEALHVLFQSMCAFAAREMAAGRSFEHFKNEVAPAEMFWAYRLSDDARLLEDGLVIGPVDMDEKVQSSPSAASIVSPVIDTLNAVRKAKLS
jgi:hypothetical protein